MEQRIMIELVNKTNILESIKGFELDEEYGCVELCNREKQSTYLFRGIANNKKVIEQIEELPNVHSIWDDSLVEPVGGIGPAYIEDETRNVIEGKVEEVSEKGEFEFLLLCNKDKGIDIEFYKKWLDKIKDGETLAKPVFQKIVKEIGDEYYLDKTNEVKKIYDRIVDKSRMKNYN